MCEKRNKDCFINICNIGNKNIFNGDQSLFPLVLLVYSVKILFHKVMSL